MLEAKLSEAGTLRKLLDGTSSIHLNARFFHPPDASFIPLAIKGLVTDANFECNEKGIHLKAMDKSRVALVAVKLLANDFK